MASLNVQHGDEVAVTIQNLLDCEKERKLRGNRPPPSITVVPGMYRDQNPSCFDPYVISIGPLHRAHKNVQEHEGLKATYMHALFARSKSPPEEILEACFSKVLGSIEEIKECYAEDVLMNYNNLELANMMVADACFILEFLQRYYDDGGLFSGNRFVMSHIFSDLVLLENQIPFFVIQDIFDCTLLESAQSASLSTILYNPLNTIKLFKCQIEILDHISDRYYYKHILDVLLKACQPPPAFVILEADSVISHSAVELDLAGVRFKPNRDGKWKMAMEYEPSGFLSFHRPTLRMPIMYIDDKTELVLRNLIAYEQSSSSNGYYFTSYAAAMDMLVDRTEDVNKLVESKVIVNFLGSNERAADLINKIVYEVYCQDFTYRSQWKKLHEYSNRSWPKYMAWLRQTYFNSPWNIIALVAVIILFLLNLVQTWFTVKSAR